MISFELANRLKDAGFPQGGPVGTFGIFHGRYIKRDKKGREDTWVFHGRHPYANSCLCPTIEDLLTELGEDFGCLDYSTPKHSEWCAYGEHKEPRKGKRTFHVYGTSPEEALCNLYLALHPHD